ncbi:hypothetical protein MPER_12771 [Moniliophthora perniciosa FA553]|nr:hypothetical protein MPER_12771 [Moniliophthora perniciosa FA553]
MNLFRAPQGGRNWEGFGADPFLTGEAAYETILVRGSLSSPNILIDPNLLGEQEHKRTMSSSNVDDRTTHEVYAHPFLRSVQAGVASLMCSYNLINGTYACENDRILNDILKRELTAWHGGEDLILVVAAQNNNTIVVVNSVGPLIVESWIDHPNVTAELRVLACPFSSSLRTAAVVIGRWLSKGNRAGIYMIKFAFGSVRYVAIPAPVKLGIGTTIMGITMPMSFYIGEYNPKVKFPRSDNTFIGIEVQSSIGSERTLGRIDALTFDIAGIADPRPNPHEQPCKPNFIPQPRPWVDSWVSIASYDIFGGLN